MRNFAQNFAKKLVLTMTVFSFVLTSPGLAAETANSNGGRNPASTQNPQPRQNTPSGTSSANANSPTSLNQNAIGASSGSNSIEDLNKKASGETKKTSGLAKIAAAVAIGVSVMYYGKYTGCMAACTTGCQAACKPPLTKAIAYAVAGVAIGVVSSMQKGKSKEFNSAARQVNAGGNGTPGGDDDDDDRYDLDGDGDIDNQDEVIRQRNNTNQVAQIRRLREQGVIINPRTGDVRMPDGRQFNAARDTTSAASMRAAGLTDAEIAAFQDATNQASAQALATDSATATPELFDGNIGGGGGGSGSAGMGSGETDGIPGSGAGAGEDRAPASVAGLSRDYNGEPIGVAADSLFLMMHRRYDFHESQGTFGTIPP